MRSANAHGRPSVSKASTQAVFYAVTRRQALFGLLVLAWSVGMLCTAALSGVLHDYEAYGIQWSNTLRGEDPWRFNDQPTNAYGPLHTFLFYLVPYGELAPKLFFASCFIIVNLLLLVWIFQESESRTVSRTFLYCLLIPANGLVVVFVFIFGSNDAFVASLVGLAIILRSKQRFVLSGVLLGMAVLVKFYPLILVALFCLQGRKIHISPLFSAGATIVLGYLAAYAKWGNSALDSILFGVSREPSLLFFGLALGEEGHNYTPALELFAQFNAPVVALAVTVVALLSFKLGLDWLEASALCLLVAFSLYKVGHAQFFLTWLVILCALLQRSSDSRRIIIYSSLPVVLFLSVYAVVFQRLWISGGFWESSSDLFRDYLGLPFVVITIGSLVVSLFVIRKSKARSKI